VDSRRIIMRKMIYVVFMCIIAFPLYSETISLSKIDKKSKDNVRKIAAGFFNEVSQKKFNSLEEYFTRGDVNFNGAVWMPTGEYVKFISDMFNKGYSFSNIKVYNFDECRSEKDVLHHAKKMYRVFNNYSLMVLAEAKEENSDKKTHVGLIFVQNDNKWKIYSVFGLDSKMYIFNESKTLKDYQLVKLDKLSLQIPVHEKFKEVKTDRENMYNYFMPGETPRDAAIQVLYLPKKDDLLSSSYGWVMYNLQERPATSLVVKYFQNGYWFECNVKDDNGVPNKMIVIAQENDTYITFINFFSFLECYKDNYAIFSNGLNQIKYTEK